MTGSEKINSIADKVIENKILTSVAHMSMAATAIFGVPASVWLVSSIMTHTVSIAEIKGDARYVELRVQRLEQADAAIIGRVEQGQGRLQEIDRLLGVIEERTQRLIRDIDGLSRRTELLGQGSTTQ